MQGCCCFAASEAVTAGVTYLANEADGIGPEKALCHGPGQAPRGALAGQLPRAPSCGGEPAAHPGRGNQGRRAQAVSKSLSFPSSLSPRALKAAGWKASSMHCKTGTVGRGRGNRNCHYECNTEARARDVLEDLTSLISWAPSSSSGFGKQQP